MTFDVLPLRTSDTRKRLANTVSFSVDCDAPRDYVYAFAPDGMHAKDAPSCAPLLRGMLDALSRQNIKATFFCIANQLESARQKTLYAEAVGQGHRIGNHTLTHPEMHRLSHAERIAEIQAGHEAISTHLGITPIGYRAPAYFSDPKDLAVLGTMGYRFDASAYRSRLTRLAYTLFVSLFDRNSEAVHPNFHFRYPANQPSVMRFGDRTKMIEWPMPAAFGLGFFGTLHSITPKVLFKSQHLRLRQGGCHVHYALHLIDSLVPESAEACPWLPTAAKRYYVGNRDPLEWLDERLAALTKDREVVTLDALSEELLQATR